MNNNDDSLDSREGQNRDQQLTNKEEKKKKIKVPIQTAYKKKVVESPSNNHSNTINDSHYEEYNKQKIMNGQMPPPPSHNEIFEIKKKDSNPDKNLQKKKPNFNYQDNKSKIKQQILPQLNYLQKKQSNNQNTQLFNSNTIKINPIEDSNESLNNQTMQLSYISDQVQNSFSSKRSENKKGINIKKSNKNKKENVFENYEKIRNQHWIKSLTDQRLNWGSKIPHYQIYILIKNLIERYGQLKEVQFKYQKQNDPISRPIPLSKKASEDYKGAKQMKKLLFSKSEQFPVYRKIKGDGNCFYRAFLFGFLQRALLHQSSLYFIKFLFQISSKFVKFQTDSIKNQIKSPKYMKNYTLYRLLQLYSYRQQLTFKNDPDMKIKIVRVLQTMFNERMRNYLEITIKSSQNYEKLDTDTQKSIIQQCREFGKECNTNQLAIMVLIQNLKVKVSLFNEVNTKGIQKIQMINFKNNQKTKQELKLLKIFLYFRPGHYDLIYHTGYAQQLYKEVVYKNEDILENQNR